MALRKSKPDQRRELGTSDPISYTCTCASKTGKTLLFYRYFSKPPLLPPPRHQSKISAVPASPDSDELEELAAWHRDLLEKWDLGGRIRVGVEGFNGTVAGGEEGVEGWVGEVCGGWSFDGLGLGDGDGDGDECGRELIRERRDRFFKPSRGCKCVFGSERSVRVKKEITPMGVEGWTPGLGAWDGVVELEPREWHGVFDKKGARDGEEKAKGEERILIDVRNYYESRIGYFIDPVTGGDTVRPAIRRFSQWPLWVRERMGSIIAGPAPDEEDGDKKSSGMKYDEGDTSRGAGKEIFTYCTGGIRCEKGVRYMQEALSSNEGVGKVYTLKGGIAAYLIWMDGEIAAGRKSVEDSLFRGRNYVFDARGSTGLLEANTHTREHEDSSNSMPPVSKCHICCVASDRLGKCQSIGCHLVLVVCEGCEGKGNVRCCASCREAEEKEKIDEGGDGVVDGVGRGVKTICECERERERGLWGDGERKNRGQGWRKERRKGREKIEGLDMIR